LSPELADPLDASQVVPELADPLDAVEVGETEDVEQFGARSGAMASRRARIRRSSSSGLTVED
jgi:hypothetical protein